MKAGTTEYKILHRYIRKQKGAPLKCEHCLREDGRLEWACVDDTYTRDLDTYIGLCSSCHKRKDAHRYIGKRFTGKNHSAESKAKTSEAMKRYWAEHREEMMARQPRGKDSGRYKHGKYSKFA